MMMADAVENDTVECPSSTTHIAIPSLFLQPFYKSFRVKNGQKLATFGNLTLKYDIFDLEDDLRCC